MTSEAAQVFAWRTPVLRELATDIDAWRAHRADLLKMVTTAEAEALDLRHLSFNSALATSRRTESTSASVRALAAEYVAEKNSLNEKITANRNEELQNGQKIYRDFWGKITQADKIERISKEIGTLFLERQGIEGNIRDRNESLNRKLVGSLKILVILTTFITSVFSFYFSYNYYVPRGQAGLPLSLLGSALISFVSLAIPESIYIYFANPWFEGLRRNRSASDQLRLDLLVEQQRAKETERHAMAARLESLNNEMKNAIRSNEKKHNGLISTINEDHQTKINDIDVRCQQTIISLDQKILAMRDAVNEQDARMKDLYTYDIPLTVTAFEAGLRRL